MHPFKNEVQLSLTADVQITCEVISAVLNEVDGAYHYHLQGQLSDGNNVATVQFVDVLQNFVIGKE